MPRVVRPEGVRSRLTPAPHPSAHVTNAVRIGRFVRRLKLEHLSFLSFLLYWVTMYVSDPTLARRTLYIHSQCRHYFKNPKHCWGDIVGSSVVLFWLLLPFTILFCCWCFRRWMRGRPQQAGVTDAELLHSSSESTNNSTHPELPEMSDINRPLIFNDTAFKGVTFPQSTHATSNHCHCAPPMFRSIPPIERCGGKNCYANRPKWWIAMDDEPTPISPPPPTYMQHASPGVT